MRDIIITVIGIIAVAVLWSGWEAYQRTRCEFAPCPGGAVEWGE